MFDMPPEIKNKRALLILIMLIAGLFTFPANNSFGATVRLGAITGMDMPTRVAVDGSGNIYVTEPGRNRLRIYNRNCESVYTQHGLNKPLGVAVDSAGRIYIGNDGPDNVSVYSPDHKLLFKLGKGDGEFKSPNSIAVSSSGLIYVSDSRDNLIKIYNPDGSSNFRFGGFGSGNGQFNSPLGLALDETAGELYVTDFGVFTDPQNGPTSGARVQVFDLNGVFKRSFGEYGTGDAKLIRPLGVASDGNNSVYITDSYQNVVQSFDPTGIWTETIYDLQNPMKTPIGIAIGKDNRIFIASQNTSSVEIYGLSSYTFLTAAPEKLTFTAQTGINPEPQKINIGNTGTVALDWSITTSTPWITADRSTGTAGPSSSETVSIGIETSTLAPGTYTGKITITCSGAAETISVTVEILPPPLLEISPLSLIFKEQENGMLPSSQTATVTISNDITGRSEWKATSTEPWLSVNPATGSSVATTISISANTAGLTAGTYSGNLTITSSGASGSPSIIGVKLILTSSGSLNVTTNLQDATFSITGPVKYEGKGISLSVTDTPSGQYNITFNKVSGYKTPASQPFTVITGKNVTITAEYKNLMANKKIIAAPGSGRKNPAEIKLLNTDGSIAGVDFIAFNLKYGVNVAAGDIDGDGIDEIIAGAGDRGSNPARIKVFHSDGTEVSGADFLAFDTKHGANVASADLDGDGKAEIIAGTGSKNISNVKVFQFSDGAVTDTGIDFISNSTSDGVQVAAGDINGDGQNEIITASKNSRTIEVWQVDTSAGSGNWTVTKTASFLAFRKGKNIAITTGDLDGDGTDEIIAGESSGKNLKAFNGDGTLFRAEFAITDPINLLSISAGDTDSDGIAEIIIGTANLHKKTPGEIRIYRSDGSLLNSFSPFNLKNGANVGLGKFE